MNVDLADSEFISKVRCCDIFVDEISVILELKFRKSQFQTQINE